MKRPTPASPARFPGKLRVPTELGFKNPKHIVSIEVTNVYPGGFSGGLRLQPVQRKLIQRHVA